MIIKDDKIEIRRFTNYEYHTFWRNYIPDGLVDNKYYIYNKEKVDISFKKNEKNRERNKVVGIFNTEGFPIGIISFKKMDYIKQQCEIELMMVNNKYKDRGFGSAAFRLCVEHIFNELQFKNIFIHIMSENRVMQYIALKNNFCLVSTDKDYYNLNGKKQDRLSYKRTNTLKQLYENNIL